MIFAFGGRSCVALGTSSNWTGKRPAEPFGAMRKMCNQNKSQNKSVRTCGDYMYATVSSFRAPAALRVAHKRLNNKK